MEEQAHRGSPIGTVRVLDLGSENVPEDLFFFLKKFSIKLHALLFDVNIYLWKLQ